MKLIAFRIRMYKNIADSGRVEVENLTVIVGKNEAGKTSLLRALHKFKPFKPDPYSIEREWPRGNRRSRTDTQVVCEVEFRLTDEELNVLATYSDKTISTQTVTVTKDYAGRFEVLFGDGLFPDKIHPNAIEAACAALPRQPAEPVS